MSKRRELHPARDANEEKKAAAHGGGDDEPTIVDPPIEVPDETPPRVDAVPIEAQPAEIPPPPDETQQTPRDPDPIPYAPPTEHRVGGRASHRVTEYGPTRVRKVDGNPDDLVQTPVTPEGDDPTI